MPAEVLQCPHQGSTNTLTSNTFIHTKVAKIRLKFLMRTQAQTNGRSEPPLEIVKPRKRKRDFCIARLKAQFYGSKDIEVSVPRRVVPGQGEHDGRSARNLHLFIQFSKSINRRRIDVLVSMPRGESVISTTS
jgi:hypothetical protein